VPSETPDRPHIPVLLPEALDLLGVRADGPARVWVDATVGAGGHLREIARRAGGDDTIIGIDRDARSLAALEAEFDCAARGRVRLVHANFAELDAALAAGGVDTITGGILADLGVSSMQLDQGERGFSFLRDGPLDMRMDESAAVTAADLVNKLPEKELADIIFEYGEERHSRLLARKIVEARPLSTTGELAALVSSCLSRFQGPRRQRRDDSHPATRTFQALRMAVNQELASLEKFLQRSLQLLAPGARLAVITFHSLEDRMVKQFLRKAAAPCICPPRQPICNCGKKPELLIITRKALTAGEEEVLANPRSRSAKLRAGEKMA